MIQKLSHISLYVTDQDSAYDFYVNKLGFGVNTDAKMDNFRWLTVSPKAQPDLEIALMKLMAGPHLDAEGVEMISKLIGKGAFGAGVFETADCQKTYEELSAKGVVFTQPPTDRFYGIEAVFRDDSGNWFSLTQRKEH